MVHSSEETWAVTSDKVADIVNKVLSAIIDGEELYNDLLRTRTWSGGTDTTWANLMWHGDKDASLATADEIQYTTDLKDAMIAVHNLYEALDNTAITTKDRFSELRLMS